MQNRWTRYFLVAMIFGFLSYVGALEEPDCLLTFLTEEESVAVVGMVPTREIQLVLDEHLQKQLVAGKSRSVILEEIQETFNKMREQQSLTDEDWLIVCGFGIIGGIIGMIIVQWLCSENDTDTQKFDDDDNSSLQSEESSAGFDAEILDLLNTSYKRKKPRGSRQ
ncbi:hypothetical protein FJ364_01965 [Candidatus Dependentiae bacterium]|nr:hypothetical protein [Candidatus Dependentiae bacterium]